MFDYLLRLQMPILSFWFIVHYVQSESFFFTFYQFGTFCTEFYYSSFNLIIKKKFNFCYLCLLPFVDSHSVYYNVYSITYILFIVIQLFYFYVVNYSVIGYVTVSYPIRDMLEKK